MRRLLLVGGFLVAAVVGAVGGLAWAVEQDQRADRQEHDEDPWYGVKGPWSPLYGRVMGG